MGVKEQFELIEDKLVKEIQDIRSERSGLDNDVTQIHKSLKVIDQELNRKLGGADYQYIMKYFERFAEYASFRDLYNKTVPMVQKI